MILSRFTPFLLAALAALACVLIGLLSGDWILAVIVGANAFFVVYLTLTLTATHRLTEKFLRKHAAASDAPVLLIFLVTLATVCAALASLFSVINAKPPTDPLKLTLALSAVPLGWLTIHTMAAIHYAHLFWQPSAGQGAPRLGLEFPGTKEPAGPDFLYFSYVIGMAAQTSDVAISGQHVRAFALIHSVASFFFNTVLVAAAVNLAISLS